MEEQALYRIRLSNGKEFGPASMELLEQWAQQGRIPADSLLVDVASNSARPVLDEPRLRAIVSAPPTVAGEKSGAADEPLAIVIPYKNPPALIGYYVGIISWLPLVGLIAGPAAIVLGIRGLRLRLREPHLRGLAHAWIAIIMGSIGTLISLGCSMTIIAAILSD